ncbi:MAG: H(+)-transporting two-sector ATPase [Nitrospirae bacterium]|nr:H(+)-transporting two-sector ATPase [Nitrospirota bacterium]
MITRMSKVEIVGPKDLLRDVVALLQQLKVIQIDPEESELAGEDAVEEKVRPFLHDERERSLFERLFLEDLRRRIDDLFASLPNVPVRTSYIEPQVILDTILVTVDKHLRTARTLTERKRSMESEIEECVRFASFLGTLDSLFKQPHTPPNLDVIMLTIKDQTAVEHIRSTIAKLTDGKFKLFTVPAGRGTLAGMITLEKDASVAVSAALTREHVPELALPPSFEALPLSGKITYLERHGLELSRQIEAVDRELGDLGRRWGPIYRRVREWIDERITLLTATASILQTRMCFFIRGWMISDDVARLRAQLDVSFGMQVVLEEKHMREKDLEHAPVVLLNRPYFRPFEIFGRLLPVPAYLSFDPTPFIGIFFPVFFGMILGDAGYGVLLVILALYLRRRYAKKREVADASQVLLASSLYTIIFGVLYGEFFGDLGTTLFGMEPLLIERRTSVIPMMVFALSAGVVHIVLGLLLGAITAFRRKVRREGFAKLLNILIILCMIAVFATFFGYLPGLLSRPIIMVILIATPFLLFSGGLLAPLELLKNIGNIISYVRIMAIGLTSVLLAFVANQMAGATGDIVLGVMAAVLLHLLNIVLGVFSPTIHALRLHYVEFFSKFIESGGKKFDPMHK